jgi:hypothetical protein
MAETKRDQVNAATEATTGTNRVKFANKVSGAQTPAETDEFVKPVYLQSKTSSRAYISINDSTGALLKKFDKVMISNLTSGDAERVARTPVRDGVHRRHLGRDGRQITFNAQFYNTVNEPWFENFMDTWNKWLRGTRLDELNAYAYVKIDERIYKGTFFSYNYAETGENDTIIVGSMVMDVDDVFYNQGLSSSTSATVTDSVVKELYANGIETVKDKTL